MKKLNTKVLLLLLLVITFSLHAQEGIVNGSVLDVNGAPLPGASILIKGTSNGVSTDFDGKFSITANNNDILVVSFVGFITQEVTLSNNKIITITLQEDAALLDEVVVIGYGSVKKSNLTAAVEMVDTKVLENRPVATVGGMLEGVVPGLNVSLQSGSPNASPDLNIRGFTGLNQSQQPLVLVDGVEQGIETINPNDVESISVLKDAAASAIYGSRAPFGVILIKTKGGKKNQKTRVNYSTSLQINSPFKLPETQNSYDFAIEMNRAFNNSQSDGYYSDEVLSNIQAFINGTGPENSLRTNGQWKAHNDAHGNTNYFDLAFKDQSHNVTHNFNISGGGEKTTYYLGFGVNTREGIYNTNLDNYSRYNGVFKIDTDVNDWLKIGMNMRYSRIETESPNYRGGTFNEDSNAPTGAAENNFWNNISYFPNIPHINPDGEYHFLSALHILDGVAGMHDNGQDDLWLTPNLEIKLAEGLTVKSNLAYNVRSTQDFRSTFQVIVGKGDGTTRRSARSARFDEISRNTGRTEYYQFDTNAEYKKQYGKHDVSALIGFQQEQNKFSSVFASRQDLYNNNVPTLSTAYGETDQVDDRLYEWATRGAYLRFSYNYDGKYLFDFNGRYDGSSRFRSEDRFDFFPSFSAGYNLAKEDFWPLKDVVNTFKITGSWAQLGNQRLDLNGNGTTNDNIDLYTYLPVYGNGTTGTILGGSQVPFVSQPGLTRADRTWEKPLSIGFGLEVGMFNNKLKGEYQWYQRRTEDALGVAEILPEVLGIGVPRANNAATETRGWEFSLNWRDEAFKIAGEPLKYGIRAVVSDYVGYVTSYGPGNEAGLRGGTWTVGEEFGAIYGLNSTGIAQNASALSAPIWGGVSNSYYYTGDLFYKDNNGDGLINQGEDGTWYDQGDRKKLGYDYPRYRYSMRLNSSWKGFNFSILLDGVGKEERVFTSSTNIFGHGSSAWSGRRVWDVHAEKGYWTPENTDAFYPRTYTGGKNSNLPTDYYLLDLSHLRIKNINLSYSLPKSVVEKISLSNVQITASAENVGFIYNNSWLDLDPTLLRRGATGYPTSATFSLGLNIGL